MKTTRFIVIACLATAATAGGQATKSAASTKTVKAASYKKDLPDSLARLAKVTEAAAAATALAKVPNGKISAVEIEREGGKLIYSYDITVAGKTGNDEVNVDAMTGAVVGKVEHESPASEKKEAADEAKSKAAATKTVPAKKPPV
jgi:uncharacterized membrane protein YkoI